MTRNIAFLRAINVGGHTVKMDYLRQLFEEMGFSGVETFIASGNVIFETDGQDAAALEKKIEAHLCEALGYEVATFLRTDAEVAAIASYQAFPQPRIDAATAFNVAFLGSPLDTPAMQKLLALQTELDVFHVHERELYWLSQVKQSESKISNAVFERALGQRATLRQVSTMRKLSAKYPPSG